MYENLARLGLFFFSALTDMLRRVISEAEDYKIIILQPPEVSMSLISVL